MNALLAGLLIIGISGSVFANNKLSLKESVFCNADIAGPEEFFISCGGHQEISDTVEQIMIAAASVRCAPKNYKQTSETRLLAFLGTVMAEANFRCE